MAQLNMGSYPYEGIAIKLYPNLLENIASKGLNYEIMIMIILLVLHNSNKIRLSCSTQMWVLHG
jgi:predicted permease